MSAPILTLTWNDSHGGMGGAHDVLMAWPGERYVGHFYRDASDDVDVDHVLNAMAASFDMLAALTAVLLFVKPTKSNAVALNAARVAIAKAEGRS